MTPDVKIKSCNANPNSDLQKTFTKTQITQAFEMHNIMQTNTKR